MVAEDSDAGLGARLDSALRTGLEDVDVDVPSLLQGSHRRARRVRNQRIAAVASAAVLVIALPVGYAVVDPKGEATSQSASVVIPSGSRAPVTRSPDLVGQPNPSAAPSAPLPSDAGSGSTPTVGGSAVPTVIPESFATFAASELPAGLLFDSTDPSPRQVLIEGQRCGPLKPDQPAPVRAISGRQWVWGTKVSGGLEDGLSVSLTITGWAAGDAPVAFRQAVSGIGSCRWIDPQQPRPLTTGPSGSGAAGALGAESWASTSSSGNRHYGRALIRIGNGIIGIQVQDPAGTAPAAELADRLARLQAARLHAG